MQLSNFVSKLSFVMYCSVLTHAGTVRFRPILTLKWTALFSCVVWVSERDLKSIVVVCTSHLSPCRVSADVLGGNTVSDKITKNLSLWWDRYLFLLVSETEFTLNVRAMRAAARCAMLESGLNRRSERGRSRLGAQMWGKEPLPLHTPNFLHVWLRVRTPETATDIH